MQGYQKEICLRCNAVNSRIINHSSGEEVCSNCGLIYEQNIIDETYEKRNFAQDNTSTGNKSSGRIGNPLKATDTLGTNVLITTQKGKKIFQNGVNNSKSMSERGFEEITHFLETKGITKMMIEQTKEIYDELIRVKPLKGRNLKYIITALYFRACRTCGMAKSFKDIANSFGLEESKIKKAYNFIRKIVINYVSPEIMKDAIINYIRVFCAENHTEKKIEKLSMDIAENIMGSNLMEGRSSQTIAGFSIFLAIKILPSNDIGVGDIEKKFATKKTLEMALKKFEKNLEVFVPSEYHGYIEGLKG